MINFARRDKGLALIGCGTKVLLVLCVVTACQPFTPGTTGLGDGPVTITFVALSPNWAHYQALAELFNTRQAGVQVLIRDPDSVPQGDDVAFSLASSADVFLSPELDPAALSIGSDVYDLQLALEKHPDFATDDFFPGLLERFQSDGKLWGIPVGMSPRVMFYSKTLFDARSVAYPRRGWTWEDFLEKALVLTDHEVGVWGFAEEWGYESFGAFVYQHGGALEDDMGPTFQDPLAAEALEWYADLARVHRVMPGPDSPDAPQPMGSDLAPGGRVAMWVGSLHQLRGSDVGIAPLPRDRQEAAMEIVYACYVSAGANHLEEVWQWIDFLTHQVPEPGLLPARRSVFQSSAYRSGVDDEAYAAYQYILERLPQPPWPRCRPWFAVAYSGLAEEGLPAVLRGERDVGQVLAEAQLRAAAVVQESTARHAGPVAIDHPTPTPPDTIGLTFLRGRAEAEASIELADAYREEHPGVVVRVAEYESGVEYPPERLAIAADVFPADSGFEVASVEGHWLNLQPLIESDPDVNLDDFYPQTLDIYRRQGDLWGLPTEIEMPILFYNETLFDAAGVAYPQADWTWDDFLAAAIQLTQGEGASRQWGFVTLDQGWLSLPLLLAAQQGGGQVDSRTAPTAPTLDHPANVDGLRWYADLDQVHGVMPPPVHFADWERMEMLVSRGHAAMWIAGIGSRYWNRMTIDIGVAPLPVPSEGQPVTMYTVLGYGISAQTLYPQESMRWLDYLTQQPRAMRGLPARRSLADQAALPYVQQGWREDVLQVYQWTLEHYADAGYDVVRAHAPWYDAIHRLYRQAVKQTLDGMDPAASLTVAQASAEAYMDCLERLGGLTDLSVREMCEAEANVPAPILWYEE